MYTYKRKLCTICQTEYQATGNCSKYCSTCKPLKYLENTRHGQEQYRRRQGMKIGRGARPEELNPMYSHGQCCFRRWAKERKETVGICEACGTSIKEATHYNWVGHHKDHNRMNNTKENLMILCKSCHQVEHKCWKHFEGVTTISKESRVDNNSKRLAPQQGDDIVCSA